MEQRELVCIVCPRGCLLTVKMENDKVAAVSGNFCPRGVKYAEVELVAPERTLTTTVRVHNGFLPLLPVVSSGTLPKAAVEACAAELRKVTAEAPLTVGDVVVSNILGLGVDIVAARSLPSIIGEHGI